MLLVTILSRLTLMGHHFLSKLLQRCSHVIVVAAEYMERLLIVSIVSASREPLLDL